MKQQYFGDIIDLFKFDLLENLHKDLELNGIIYVPMLTDNDASKEGEKRNYSLAIAGTKNIELIKFFQNYENIENRKITEIQKYFESNRIFCQFYSKEKFSHRSRKDYFLQMQKISVKNQAIFFDPDNGLQVKKNNHKHLLFDEVLNCLEIIDEDSLIVVIQFRDRTIWAETQDKKLTNLKKYVSNNVILIANHSIAFFIITKTSKKIVDIKTTLTTYQKQYPNLVIK